MVAKRYRYTGKERDEESGLYYHGARYYIPWLCRWVSVDPINNENYNLAKGYGLEKNLERHFLHLTASSYEYCKDNPIGNIDPDGEQAVPLNLPQAVPRTIPMRPPFSRNGFRNTGRGVGMNPNNVIIPPAGNLPARFVQVNDRTGAGYNSAAIEIIRNWFAPEPKRPTQAQSEVGFKKFVEDQRSKQQNFAPFVSPEAKNQYFINQGLQNDVTKLSPIEISKLLNRVALGKGSQQDLAYIPHIPSTYKDGSATLKQFPSLEKILGKEPAKPEDIQFGCEDIAQRVQKLIGGEFLHITPMFGNRLGPVKYEKGEVSSWYHHVAVMKDGIVYDKMTGAKGMSFKDYKKMFEYNDAIKFETSNKKNP